jgi:23S rRNA (adenine2503-C2)-methyltransferase
MAQEIGVMELLGKSKEELRGWCAELGEPAYRGAQIYHALYAERKFEFARMTNLPAAFRERLGREARISLPQVKQRFVSTDGSVRYLFGLGGTEGELNTEITEGTEKSNALGETKTKAGEETQEREKTEEKERNQEKKNQARKKGEKSQGARGVRTQRAQRPASVEAVFMPSEGRQTICISTQAGCAVDCHFCLTAQLGLIRNLSAGEILGQVLVAMQEAGNGAAPGAGSEEDGKDADATGESDTRDAGLAPQTKLDTVT